jgi:hypothetical protein
MNSWAICRLNSALWERCFVWPYAKEANQLDRRAVLARAEMEQRLDPGGLLSTLPAIGTCLLGVTPGLPLNRLRQRRQNEVARAIVWRSSRLLNDLIVCCEVG